MTTAVESGFGRDGDFSTIERFESRLERDSSLSKSVRQFLRKHTETEDDYSVMMQRYSHSGKLLVVQRCQCLYGPCDHVADDRFKVAILDTDTRQESHPRVVDAEVFSPRIDAFDIKAAQTTLYLGHKAIYDNGDPFPGNETIRYMNVSQMAYYRPAGGFEEPIYPTEALSDSFGPLVSRVALRGL